MDLACNAIFDGMVDSGSTSKDKKFISDIVESVVNLWVQMFLMDVSDEVSDMNVIAWKDFWKFGVIRNGF